MRPKWLNPSTYNNLDIRVIDPHTVIVKNVDPFDQSCVPTGVDLKFTRFYRDQESGSWFESTYQTRGSNNYYRATATVNAQPNDPPIVLFCREETTDDKDLFEYILKLGRLQEDQFRKNCHIRILKVLDGPDSPAANAEIVLTPRELS